LIQKIEGISIIGHITEADEGTKFVATQGSEIELQAQGWNAMG
jgi:thiamine-monophosphate kinase